MCKGGRSIHHAICIVGARRRSAQRLRLCYLRSEAEELKLEASGRAGAAVSRGIPHDRRMWRWRCPYLDNFGRPAAPTRYLILSRVAVCGLSDSWVGMGHPTGSMPQALNSEDIAAPTANPFPSPIWPSSHRSLSPAPTPPSPFQRVCSSTTSSFPPKTLPNQSRPSSSNLSSSHLPADLFLIPTKRRQPCHRGSPLLHFSWYVCWLDCSHLFPHFCIRSV